MYEAAKLEIVWEKYKRNMSILDELNANDTIGHVSLIFIGKIAKISLSPPRCQSVERVTL